MKLLTFILVTIYSLHVFAGESTIPLAKNLTMPSDDLIYNGTVLTARDASLLTNVDLSTLNPLTNDVWLNRITKTAIDDQNNIALNNSSAVVFQGGLLSNSGLYRFNVLSEENGTIYTVHLDKTLHTLLLRKNLLRKLGYDIPETKYLKNLVVKFQSELDLDQFLKKDIPENTLGASDRWVKAINGLEVTLQDIAVTQPSERDFYNVAMGIPTEAQNSRTIRSLIVPYNLLDLSESVNKFNWVDGKIDNRGIILSHFTNNQFNTSIDDADWMMRKINKLTRNDFKEMVDNAYFPIEVGALVLEKIISRRNHLNKLFSLPDSDLKFDGAVSGGKITEQNFPGFASRFAYGNAQSPLDQMEYYFASIVQSNVIDNLIGAFNKQLIDNSLTTARSAYFTKQFQDGLQHYIQTGDLQPIGIGTWTSPNYGIHLLFSRDIVIGNYLGTNNLVQMADTIGGSFDLGYHIGIEGLGNDLSSSVQMGVSVVRTFTHLKPVKSLKVSMHEPYRNIFVNYLKNSLAKKYYSLAELKKMQDTDPEKSKKLQELLKLIETQMDVGESLIMTDQVMPSVAVNLNMVQAILQAGVGVTASVATISRIQFYKKAASVIQIFDDSGLVSSIDLSFQLKEYIPIIKIGAKFDQGKYNIKSYNVNLSADSNDNPNLFTNAQGIYEVLNNKNFEILESVITPVKLKATFLDKTFRFSFLFWKLKSLYAKTYYDVEAKDGVAGNYFNYTKYFMSGINFEAFAKQLANYYLSTLANTVTDNISISVQDNKLPGETLFGKSTLQTVNYEAEVDDHKNFSKQFLSLSNTKEGWSTSKKGLLNFIKQTNDKFQSNLFDVGQIDFQKLRLYRIGYHLNLYERGIARLNQITTKDIDPIEVIYKREAGCRDDDSNNNNNNTLACGYLSELKYKIHSCSKSKTDEDRGVCLTGLLNEMFSDLKFNDFKNLMGENNIYVYASIDGLRENSEILNDTIFNVLG